MESLITESLKPKQRQSSIRPIDWNRSQSSYESKDIKQYLTFGKDMNLVQLKLGKSEEFDEESGFQLDDDATAK